MRRDDFELLDMFFHLKGRRSVEKLDEDLRNWSEQGMVNWERKGYEQDFLDKQRVAFLLEELTDGSFYCWQDLYYKSEMIAEALIVHVVVAFEKEELDLSIPGSNQGKGLIRM